MTQNEIRQQEASRTWAILICVLLLTGTIGYLTYDVGNVMLRDTSFMATRKIEALGTTHFRFREIYRGPSMEAHHQNGAMVGAAASYQGASVSRGHAATSYSNASLGNVSYHGSGSSAGPIGYTTSSASLHSYGGGASQGGIGATGGRSASASAGTSSAYGGISAIPSMAYNPRPRIEASVSATDPSTQPSGPRKIYSNGDGEYDGEYDPGQDKYWNDRTESWESSIPDGATKIEDGKAYRYDAGRGEWVLIQDQEEPGVVPLGDTPILLLILMAGVYVYYHRKREVE